MVIAKSRRKYQRIIVTIMIHKDDEANRCSSYQTCEPSARCEHNCEKAMMPTMASSIPKTKKITYDSTMLNYLSYLSNYFNHFNR